MTVEDKIASSTFNKLYNIDTRGRAVTKDDGKKTLDYLPWAVTYSEVAKNYNLEYGFVESEITKMTKKTRTLEDGTVEETVETVTESVPYIETDAGLMVKTWVKIGEITKEMMLPVYDASYKAMKLKPYTYNTKYGEKRVEAATMGDIYKNLMRCFAKNLSMWGVGLNYWTKEDAPESVLSIEKLHGEINEIYLKKKKRDFTDEELLSIIRPLLPEELNGNYTLCDDEETLKNVKKKLLTLRKE